MSVDKRLLAITLFAAGVSACATTQPSESAQPAERASLPTGIPLKGRVIYPDGSPASGATVYADPTCRNDFGFSNLAHTSEAGSFEMLSVDPGCGQIRFTAEKREDFWLRTGDDPFYPRRNGTAPELVLTEGQFPEPVTIQLDLRGGTLELRAWDLSASRYISVSVCVECSAASCGILCTGTGPDGAGHTVFLPPRQYRASLNFFSCGTDGAETYQADQGPSITIDVVEGQLRSSVLKFDPKTVRAVTTWYQPKEFPCRE